MNGFSFLDPQWDAPYGTGTVLAPQSNNVTAEGKPTATTFDVGQALAMFATGIQGYAATRANVAKQESLTMSRAIAMENAALSRINQNILRAQAGLQQVNIRQAGAQAGAAARSAAIGSGFTAASGREAEALTQYQTKQASISADVEAQRQLLNEQMRERSLLREAELARKGVGSLRRGNVISTLGTIGSIFGQGKANA